MNFSEKLQLLRKERGLSQEGLAELLGISPQAVAKWELGQSYPDIENLIRLSNKFMVSIDKLIKGNDEKCSIVEENNRRLLSDKEVIDFLIKSKKKTYAGQGAEVLPSRPNSHDLQYIEGDLKYIDTYLGGEKFSGEEALWRNNVPFWSMNYIGRIIDEGFSSNFLKEALLLVKEDFPYRGPLVYENGEYKYHCIVNGEFQWFKGYEEIFYNNKKVYECLFHGGSVK